MPEKSEFEKCIKMGQENIGKIKVEDELVKFSSLVEEQKCKVSLERVIDVSVGFDVNGGNVIGEGVANIEKNVKSEVKDNVDLKKSDEIVDVKSGGILSGECVGDKSCEIVCNCRASDSGVSGFVGSRSIDSDGTKSGEKVSDGESAYEVSSESGAEESSESEVSSESEFESSSPSLSESSSEEEDGEDDDGEMKEKALEGEVDVEGMIEDFFVRELFDWCEKDKIFALPGLCGLSMPVLLGLTKFANEVKVPPPVPPIAVTLNPCHETLPVGVVLSVMGAQVIVEGVEKHVPLNKGSILWITEKRSPLGIVDKVSGPVKNPYYVVRYNSKNEVPDGIQHGTLISFVSEFANHVLNNGNLYKKRYDPSVENDEESSDEAEFSDDEKEAECKRMQKVSKRGPKAQIVENRNDTKRKAKRKADQHLSATQPNKRLGQVPSNQSQGFPPSFLDPGKCSNSLRPVQAFAGGPGFVPVFPQVTQVPNLVAPSNGFWMNRFPFQPPHSMGFPNASTPNNILQFQQNLAQQHYQMLFFNGMPLQQQFNTGQLLPSNFVLPGGQPSFGAGATYTPMNPMMTGQYNFGQFHAAMSQNNFSQSQAAINMRGFSQAQAPVEMQGQHFPAFIGTGQQGVLLTGCQSEQNSNSQPLSDTASSTGDSQDFSNSVGVGLASKSHRKGREQFGGGRGRRQSR